MKKEYFLTFEYDERGYGDLILRQNSLIIMEFASRTGSLKWLDNIKKIKPINLLAPDIYRILMPPVFTSEPGMHIKKDNGWKIRLFTSAGKYTHYLIHPDGGKGGTKGCIGIQQTDALVLKERLNEILRLQSVIKCYVNKPWIKNHSQKGGAMPAKILAILGFVPKLLRGVMMIGLIKDIKIFVEELIDAGTKTKAFLQKLTGTIRDEFKALLMEWDQVFEKMADICQRIPGMRKHVGKLRDFIKV